MRVWVVLLLAAQCSAKTCDVSAAPYNAKGDGKTLNTDAIQRAFDDCAGSPADLGVIVLPGGANQTYLSGALFLRSHTVVHIGSGAILQGSTLKDNATWPWQYTRIAGFMRFGHASLLNGAVCKQMKPDCPTGCWLRNLGDQCAEWSKLQNVRIEGGGTIDGNGESWWKAGSPYVDVRPSLLNLMWIDGLVLQDLLITRPPFWTIHPIFCNNVEVRNVNVQTVGTPNGDGIDVDSTTNVLIENCTFNTGDDCIALKSGMDADGRAVGIPTSNVTVRDTSFLQGHGCSIGSDMSGGVEGALFENLRFRGTGTGVRIKDQRGRGGYVRNITYRNATMDSVGMVLQITQFYHSGIPPTNQTATPTFENFLVQDVTATRSKSGEVLCLPEWPCTGMRFERVSVTSSASASAAATDAVASGFVLANAYGSAVNTTPIMPGLKAGKPPPTKPGLPSPPGLADLAVFIAGEAGYHTFRIPAVVQTRREGVVLAFCEGRKLSGADHGWNDIVMKRSTDNGHTWSNVTVVHGESTPGNDVCIGNPAPILDLASGRVWMIFSRNNKQIGAIYSDDEGLTWPASGLRNLTESVMVPNGWTTAFTGLSAGFTLDPAFGHGNRLIVCSNHDSHRGRFSASIYSDDAGETWKAGAEVGPTGSTECNLASTREGVFMYTRMWDQKPASPLKTYGIAKSGDGGASFGTGFEPYGIDWPQPDCQGTMRMVQSPTGSLCFTLTAPFGGQRANMTLSYSCGYSPTKWTHDRVLWAGPAAYSSMDTSRDGNSIFVAYERGVKSAYEEIRLTQILTPEWAPSAV